MCFIRTRIWFNFPEILASYTERDDLLGNLDMDISLSLAQIQLEVEARLANPDSLARIVVRLAESLTSSRINTINRIVGRAANALPDSKYWTREIPDYQRLLMEYVGLKRRLGLYRKRWISEHLSYEDSSWIIERISDLTQEVKKARVKARELRDQVWYGHFKES